MENFTHATAVATRPFGWLQTAAVPGTGALGVMPVRVKDRSANCIVNYIGSTQAAGSLRLDRSAAKQAAPPRGIPR